LRNGNPERGVPVFSRGGAGLNNGIKTRKKISNGCPNFERFRKRVLLIMTYSKERRGP